MLPVKLICGRHANRDGTNPVYIQYCLNARVRTLLNTEIYIPLRYWNRKLSRISKDIPPQFGDCVVLNEALENQIRISQDIIWFAKKTGIEDEIGFLKKNFRPNFDTLSLGKAGLLGKLVVATENTKDNLDLYVQIDDYIKSKEKKVRKDMPRIYRNMKEHLMAFEEFRREPIVFDSFDLNFYEEFVDFLSFDYVRRRRKNNITG